MSQSVISAAFALRWSHPTTPSRALAIHKTALSAQGCLQSCRFPQLSCGQTLQGDFPLCTCHSQLAKQGGGWTSWREATAARMWPPKIPSLSSRRVKTSCKVLQTCPSHTLITQRPGTAGNGCWNRCAPSHEIPPCSVQEPCCRGSSPSVHPQQAPKALCFLGSSTSCFVVSANSRSHSSACIPQPEQCCDC